MKKTIGMIMILCFSFSLFAVGMTGKGKKKKMRPPMIIPTEILDEVGVSEKIKTSIKDEGEALKNGMKEEHEKVKTLNEAVRAELLKTSPDRTLIDKNIAAIVEIKKNGMLKIEKFKTDVFLKLTLEQRKKAFDLFKKRNRMMRRMMKNGRPPMPPEGEPEPEME